MIKRCSLLRVGRVASHIKLGSTRAGLRKPLRSATTRRYASSASRTSPAPASDVVSPLVGLSDELNRIAPRFDVDADDVQILRGPTEFYKVLKVSH